MTSENILPPWQSRSQLALNVAREAQLRTRSLNPGSSNSKGNERLFCPVHAGTAMNA